MANQYAFVHKHLDFVYDYVRHLARLTTVKKHRKTIGLEDFKFKISGNIWGFPDPVNSFERFLNSAQDIGFYFTFLWIDKVSKLVYFVF